MKNEEKKGLEKSIIDDEIYDEPIVFAVPCDVPFVVAPDKAKEFNELKANPELFKKIEEATKKLNIKVELKPIEYQVYADSPKTIITVPWDPKREEREHESYLKFMELMKKVEEEKTKTAKEPEGPVLRKVNKPNK